jgi:hypothetical protein
MQRVEAKQDAFDAPPNSKKLSEVYRSKERICCGKANDGIGSTETAGFARADGTCHSGAAVRATAAMRFNPRRSSTNLHSSEADV